VGRRVRKVVVLLEQAERDGVDLAMSAATIIEASHEGIDQARLNWLRLCGRRRRVIGL
jgi:hypothetical protein